jgi:hypothetical protein
VHQSHAEPEHMSAAAHGSRVICGRSDSAFCADLRARTIVRSLSVMLPDPSPALVDWVVVALGPHGWLVLARSSTAPPSRPLGLVLLLLRLAQSPPRPRGRTALSRAQIAGHSARVSGRRDRRLTDAGRTPVGSPRPTATTARRGTAAAPAHAQTCRCSIPSRTRRRGPPPEAILPPALPPGGSAGPFTRRRTLA